MLSIAHAEKKRPDSRPAFNLTLDFRHFPKRIAEPVVVVRRTVLLGVRVADGIAIPLRKAFDMGVDGFLPRAPTGRAPAPRIVRQEAVCTLGGLGIGNSRRPARIDAVFPCSGSESLPLAGKRGPRRRRTRSRRFSRPSPSSSYYFDVLPRSVNLSRTARDLTAEAVTAY